MRKPIEVSGDRFKEAEQSVKYKDREKKTHRINPRTPMSYYRSYRKTGKTRWVLDLSG